MKIYKISQDVNNDWDTFDSAVVIANNKDEAQHIMPGFDGEIEVDLDTGCWCDPEYVKVEYIGLAATKHHEKSLILASFNAG